MSVEIVSNKRFFHEVVAPKLEFFKHITSFFYYVLLLIGIGFGFYAYSLWTQHFTTPYGGDFSQQGIPFMYQVYDSWWTLFKTGNFPNFAHNVFIGADNIQANTFYNLFAPFTYPILFFPREWIPHIMPLMSIARMVVGGLLFRVYLKYMGVSEKSARIFSIAYAFTGWICYYLWFNSFYEVLTFMPLFLLGIEKIIKQKQIWAIWLGFFFIGISNYFFLWSIGIFGVGYAIFRFFQTFKERETWKEHLKVIGMGLLGFALGALSSMIVVFPALITSFGIERSTSSLYFSSLKEAFNERDWTRFFKYFFYDWHTSIANSNGTPSNYYYSQYYGLMTFFFPVVSGRYVNLMKNTFENPAIGAFLYTPCLIMFFDSLYLSIKEKKISHLLAIAVLSICMFVPFFYFLCGMFANIYGRWVIVVSISALTYIAINFDKRHEIPRWITLISGLFSVGVMILLFFKAEQIALEYSVISSPTEKYWLVNYEIAVTLVETAIMTTFWKSKHLNKFVYLFLTVEVIAMGTFCSLYHGLQSYETSVNGGYPNFLTEQKLFDKLEGEDDSFHRIIFTRAKEGTPNLPEALGYNGISTFHTFYNNEVDEFQRLSWILKGDTAWSGSIFSKRTNLDELLGVKYYVTKDSETSYYYTDSDGNRVPHVYEPNIPLGYELYRSEYGYRIYKNKYQIDFATSFDTLYKFNTCAGSVTNTFYPGNASDVIRNEEVYFKGAILYNDDLHEIELEYGDNFTYIDGAPSRDARRIYTKGAQVYMNPDKKEFSPSNPDRDIKPENLITVGDDKNIKYYQIVFEPLSGEYFDIGALGAYYMLDYPVANNGNSPSFNSVVWLIGEDENGKSKVVTFDECRWNQRNGTTNSGAKTVRGLYSAEKIKRIIICSVGGRYRTNAPLYYEPFEDTITRYQNAIANGVKNVKYGVDRFEFDTDYLTNRYVVTQVAFTKGWKVKATSETGEVTYPKVYKADGAFVSFVAPKGNIHYEMTYTTPYMDIGTVMTVASIIGMLSVTGLGIYFKNKKKPVKAPEA